MNPRCKPADPTAAQQPQLRQGDCPLEYSEDVGADIEVFVSEIWKVFFLVSIETDILISLDRDLIIFVE